MRAGVVARREREGLSRRARCSPERANRLGSDALSSTAPEIAQTLDALMTAAWAGLCADAPIACPVCDATMEPLWSAGAGVVGGRCRDCGAEMS